MFRIEKSKVGVTVDYLTKTEEQQNTFSVDYGDPKLQQHFKFDDFTADRYANYLEQNNPHYAATIKGGLAETWGLKYSKETYVDLMSGIFPNDGIAPKNLKKNGNIITVKEDAQTGLDTISNCPKSVSIEFARGPKEKQDKIHRALVKTTEQMFDKIAKQIKPSCKDPRYQDIVPNSTKLCYASFAHYENRGYEYTDEATGKVVHRLEPNLHLHNSLMNYAEFEIYVKDKDGNKVMENGVAKTEKKLLAIDPDEVFKRQLENSAFNDTLLNSNLQKEGFKTEAANESGLPSFRISGYTREQEESLSKRSEDIKKYVEEQKALGNIISSTAQAEAEYKNSLRKNTAMSKDIHDTTEILENIKTTVDMHISKEQQETIDRAQRISEQKYQMTDYSKIMKSQAFETDGVIDRTKLMTAIYQELRFSKTFNSAEELEKEVEHTIAYLSDPEKMGKHALINMGEKFSRVDIAKNERELVTNIDILKSTAKTQTKAQEKIARDFVANYYKENEKQIKKTGKGFSFNRGQLEAMKLGVENKQLIMVIGDAGTGKTTTFIKCCNDYHSSIGRKVFGLSVGTVTSRALEDGNVKKENCLNTKEFLRRAFEVDKSTNEVTDKFNEKFMRENLNSTLIFDEAGMSGVEDMKKITDFVNRVNSFDNGDCRLVLVGDHKQLSSVSYGAAFSTIKKKLDKSSVGALTENTRQRNDVAKTIAEAYRDKNIDLVFSTLESNNLLVTAESQEEVNKRLVEDYMNDKSKSKIILCGLNAEIDSVNDEVRKGLSKQALALKGKDNEIRPDYANSVSINVMRESGAHKYERERSFCEGEEIVFLKNHRNKEKNNNWQISNSDRGIIKSLEKLSDDNFRITVDIEGQNRTFETKKYNNFNHAYAVSTHKSQGQTVENTYHLGNVKRADSHNGYVNGSRHKDQYKLYLNTEDIKQYKKNSLRDCVKETTLNNQQCQDAVDKYLDHAVRQKKKEEAQTRTYAPMPEHMHNEIDKSKDLKQAITTGIQLISLEENLEKNRLKRVEIEAERQKKELEQAPKIEHEELGNNIDKILAKYSKDSPVKQKPKLTLEEILNTDYSKDHIKQDPNDLIMGR